MKAPELLMQLHDLEFYTDKEWKDYLTYFTEDVRSSMDSCKSFAYNEIISRIKNKKGASPVVPDRNMSQKIKSPEELTAIKDNKHLTLGIVSGCYDLFHLGHATGMAYAKQHLQQYPNPALCALVLSDENIRVKKGQNRPVLDINERFELLCELCCVDYVVPLQDPNCLSALKIIRPNFFFKARKDNVQGIVKKEIELVQLHGGAIAHFPEYRERDTSTTTIINTVLAR